MFLLSSGNAMMHKYIEDICFFSVNTKYISLSELKTSEFSPVRSTSEKFYIFNSRGEIYLVFTEKKANFIFILYQFTMQAVKMQKQKLKTQIMLVPHCYVLTKKMNTHTLCFRS